MFLGISNNVATGKITTGVTPNGDQ